MGDIVKEMGDQSPYRFLWFDIFLSAHVAKAAIECGATVEADLFRAFL